MEGAKAMNIKRLDSGYWHFRLDANRFAQWPCWERLTLDQCSPHGWWTQAEVDAVNEMADTMQQEQGK